MLPNTLLLAQNQARIFDRALVLQVALLSGLVAAVIAAVLAQFIEPKKAGITTAAFAYTFYLQAWTSASGPHWARFVIWLCMGLFAAFALNVLIGSTERALRIATGIVAVAVVTTSGIGMLGGTRTPAAVAFTEMTPVRTPNVYLFVLDGLGRPDVLRAQFPTLDVDQPLQAFSELGFDVSDRSTANYPRTHLSIPSMLSASYPSTEENVLAEPDEWAFADATLSGNNELVQMMKAAGYEYWHTDSGIWGHAACDTDFADVCLGKEAGVDHEAKAAIWESTPFKRSPFGTDAQDPTTVVDNIIAASTESAAGGAGADAPKLVFSHILSPHTPYRFTRDCSPINVGSTSDGWQPEYMGHYAGAAQCLFTQLETAFGELIEHDPEAMILVVSDHGPTFNLRWLDEWSDREIHQRLSNFRMVRMPEGCDEATDAAHSLINTVPMIRSCLTGQEPELVEPKFFTVSEAGVSEVDSPNLIEP